jgi:hypothetical protein
MAFLTKTLLNEALGNIKKNKPLLGTDEKCNSDWLNDRIGGKKCSFCTVPQVMVKVIV